MQKNKTQNSTIALNKKARFDYFIDDEIEAGLSLQGWEVKAIRAGKVNLSESYVIFSRGEAFLFGAHINPLIMASSHTVVDPIRTRKLLLAKKEINYILGKNSQDGMTIVPLSMYWKHSWVKIKIGVARGKKLYDKRDTIKEEDWKRSKARILKNNLR